VLGADAQPGRQTIGRAVLRGSGYRLTPATSPPIRSSTVGTGLNGDSFEARRARSSGVAALRLSPTSPGRRPARYAGSCNTASRGEGSIQELYIHMNT
jgi:hypothetical protein